MADSSAIRKEDFTPLSLTVDTIRGLGSNLCRPTSPRIVMSIQQFAIALSLGVAMALMGGGARADTEMDQVLLSTVTAGNVLAYRSILASGGSIHARDTGGNSAAVLAARFQRYIVLRDLVERGAPVGGRGSLGNTALGFAVLNDDFRSVRLLLGADADPDEADELGNPPLIAAARLGRTEIARLLLDAGADPDLPGAEGETPLIVAMRADRPAVVALLRARNARADVSLAAGNCRAGAVGCR